MLFSDELLNSESHGYGAVAHDWPSDLEKMHPKASKLSLFRVAASKLLEEAEELSPDEVDE
jgi:hypothetical protein